MYPERGVELIDMNPQSFHQVLKQDGAQELRFFSIKVELFSDLVNQIQKQVWKDEDYKVIKKLARGELVQDYSIEPQAKLLLFKYKVVIPSNQELQLYILQKHHEKLLAGVPGQEKTLKLIKRDCYWAGMNKIIKDYVFSFLKNIGSHAYHLKLPQQWKSAHTIFHVSLSEPVKKSTIPNRNQLPPPTVLVEEQKEWELAQVLY
ncbi:hypothetical protein O181_036129 [Austropuccinia psidii MF-1]|uniref:Integrase zinc-binding domain-containing protein n=1 Tax=Austropuccinia psidii MF-1 TaxID=1389203 RepID=A0A9Q3D3Z4_9BASI|nr:hypothetical protein [Austropuccinia psidii MF-1]